MKQICPKCQTVTDEPIPAAKCPECGSPFELNTPPPPVISNDETIADDSTVTIQNDNDETLIDDTAETVDQDNQTFVEEPEKSLVDLQQTMQSDPDFIKTINADVTADTVQSDTIPAGEADTLVEVADKTISSVQQTIESNADIISTLTSDASNKNPDVNKMWAETIPEGSTVNSSLGGTSSAPGLKISVKQRVFKDNEAEDVSGADFVTVDVLGEGGMGIVHAGIQKSVDRTIAIKMIKADLADYSNKEKFLSEALVTADLEHPNIVPVYDLGSTENGDLFYAMKKVKGSSWQDIIADKDIEENLSILMNTCDAVAFAHSRGVIHRDLKPENVMLGGYGEVLVMDWGLAASINSYGKAAMLDKNSSVCGTPCYMPPEMAIGDYKKVGVGSDIYLLGAILYHIITAKPPHEGKGVMECVVNAAHNIISSTFMTGELMDIAMMAMATEPSDRYLSVKDFHTAIQQYLFHFESTMLSDKASDNLRKARSTQDYSLFARAQYGYEEALSLWGDNSEAKHGAKIARIDYAQSALTKGDLDLASSLVTSEDDEKLALEISIAQKLQLAKQRRLKRLSYGVAALILFIIAGLSVGSYLINEGRKAAQVAEEIAVEERNNAVVAEKEAKKQTSIANKAKIEIAKALQKYDEATKALENAKTAEEREVARRKLSEAMSNSLSDKLKNRKSLIENKWWIFDRKEAAERQQQASKRIKMPRKLVLKLPQNSELTMILIPRGTFAMGSPVNQKNYDEEEYLHRVELTHDFYIGETEISLAQWKAVTGKIPKKTDMKAKGDIPVSNISWVEVQKNFIPAIQKYAPKGMKLRLPTEAEWEYACRAGTPSTYNTNKKLTEFAWHSENSDSEIKPIKTKTSNNFGLYDMHGNVSEFCLDNYEEEYYFGDVITNPLNDNEKEYKVIRGGGWVNLPKHCRSAYRSWAHNENPYPFLGLRLVLIKE